MNRKHLTIAIALLFLVGTGVSLYFSFRNIREDQQAPDAGTAGVDTSEILKTGFESVVSLASTVEITDDETYPYGTFCRVNYLPVQDTFAVTFGGSNSNIQEARAASGQSLFGGAEGGNGYSYKSYSKAFAPTGENGIVHSGGGDAASVMADGYYYFIAGVGEDNWIVKKIDPKTWEMVDSIVLDLVGGRDILNDMMLAYANGYLIASSVYDAGGQASGDQRKTDPFAGLATHNHILTTDLELVDEFILDDIPHINGSYVVFADGMYHYITSSAYFGNVIVMHYNEQWEYQGYDTLEEWGNWAQGAVFDEGLGRYYVAYLDFDMNESKKVSSSTNVVLGIYDRNWDLIEKVAVTNLTTHEKLAGRPSVILQDEKLYVSYDLETFAVETREENKDWECEVKIYDVVRD